MDTSGLDPSVWLTFLGVVIVFFVLPGTYLEVDRRKRLRRARAPLPPSGAARSR